jgi:hypothetical protein
MRTELSPNNLLATWVGSSVPQEKAAALIISTVVAYPRRDKIGLIIADSLMCEMDGGVCPSNGVSLLDVASLTANKPDPSDMARCINTWHKEAGVSTELPAKVAAAFVRRCGLLSLENLRRATIFHLEDEGWEVPVPLRGPIISFMSPSCGEVQATDGVPDLQTTLYTKSEIRFSVASSIQEAAENVRFPRPSTPHGATI